MSCSKCGPGEQCSSGAVVSVKDGRQPTIALVGNPNVGKSTLFNHLTGARQRVVNAPGTTVHVAAGQWRAVGARILDLPGTYSLVATSPDEQVVVDTMSGAEGSMTDPNAGLDLDLVLVVLDGSSMTRSLYLLAQVAQTGRPAAAVVTMADVAEQNGEPVNVAVLAKEVGIPVMVMDPRNGKDYAVLNEMIASALATRPRIQGIESDPSAPGYYPLSHACDCGHHDAAEAAACACCAARPTQGAVDETSEAEMNRAASLFSWVDRIEAGCREHHAEPSKLSRSDKIDRVLLNPVIGVVVFFGLMWALFKTAGEWVGPLQDQFEAIFASSDEGVFSVANGVLWCLEKLSLTGGWLESFLVNGLCAGLGVVASFFPLMFIIYAALSLLEDSGYMARAAFLGDRLMRHIGLDGRVILPLIMGFGCNLPSLAAARTLPSARQRLVTVIITPFTSCAARLTIYLMIARIFFKENVGDIVFAMYALSIVFVVVAAWILKFFITRDEQAAPLMLVLPAYQVPRLLVWLKITFRRAWSFVTGAGKIIVLMTAVVWFMGAVPMGDGAKGMSFADSELQMEDSLYGKTAQALEPIFAPTGFGEWHMTGALMTGFVAKETVVSSVVTSYNLDPEEDAGDAEDKGSDLGKLPELVTASLTKSAGEGYQGLAAFAFILFVLAYTPCMATVAEQAKLIGGKVTTIALVAQLAFAWLIAVGVFQIGKLFL